MSVRILMAGEQGMVVEFGDKIDRQVNHRVHMLAKKLATIDDQRIIETVPTYRSLLIYFDPLRIAREQLAEIVRQSLLESDDTISTVSQAKVVYVPTCYGGEFGPDLDFIASHTGLSAQEVITIHTATPYLVYMLGFTPGFPYLGGMSEKIAAPRLEKPRTRIPAGSVGIAGSQTGFYPIESPGGWRLIGRTPLQAFSSQAETPFLFAAGDYLQFQAVTRQEYDLILCEVETGKYVPETGILELAGEAG